MRGFLRFMWAVLWLYRVLLHGLADDVLVMLRIKWRPATGRARWRWER